MVPPWCRCYSGAIFGAALWRHGRRPLRQTGRPDGRRKSCVGGAAIACGCRRRGATQFRCGSIADRMGRCTPSARMRHAAERRRGRIDEDALLFDRRHGASEHGRAAASRDHLTTRGARRDKVTVSLIEAGTVAATEAVAGPGEASPGVPETETRDAIDAEQEAAGPCRKRHAAVAASDGTATASFGAIRRHAGPDRPRRRTADRPAKLNRTPARAADAAPGAVDSPAPLHHTDARTGIPVYRNSWWIPLPN